jgi:hypothetical protein
VKGGYDGRVLRERGMIILGEGSILGEHCIFCGMYSCGI